MRKIEDLSAFAWILMVGSEIDILTQYYWGDTKHFPGSKKNRFIKKNL